ncbi:MAG: PAS domain S-box protein [Calditrichaeota bacterium]|nr:MAG: PAS domain S-box protein [Calditrichota bacterium]MBL1205648.1 PAS domain S-box protein [Calditrichota bacterium]NOG45476.1 PAS domain S-box protein [Calditrichota bacterium]
MEISKNLNLDNLSVLNLVPENIAVIENDGTIIFYNESWQNFAKQNNFRDIQKGDNYFQIKLHKNNILSCLPEFEKNIALILKGDSDYSEIEYQCPYKESLIWFKIRLSKYDKSEAPKFIVIHSNITKQKQNENTINKFTQAVKQNPSSIIITDTLGNIEYVNPKFCETSGYKAPEILGKNPRILKGTKTSQEGYKQLWQTITNGYEWRGEFHNKKKNGDFYWETASISPIKNNSGEVTHFVGTKEDVTERKSFEQALWESEEKFRRIAASTRDAIIMMDHAGKISFWNKASERIFGYKSQDVLGKELHVLLAPKRHWKVFQKYRNAFIEEGEGNLIGETIEMEAITADQSEIAIEFSLSSLNIKGTWNALAVIRDITKRKKTEMALQGRERILSAVAHISDNFLKNTNMDKILQDVVNRLGKATSVSRVYIFKNHAAENGTSLVSQKYEWCSTNAISQIDNNDLQNISWQESGMDRWKKTLSQNRVLTGLVKDFPQKERDILEPQQIISVAFVPVFAGELWWGFIGFDDCFIERDWSKVELDALKAAAGIIGSAILNKKAAMDLAKKEEQYRILFDLSPSGIVLEDAEGVILEVNPAYCESVGYTKEELIGNNVKMLTHPDAINNVSENISRLIAGETLVHTEKSCKKDGSACYMELNEKKIVLPNGDDGVLCLANDISQQRMLENQLLHTQKMEAIGTLAGGIAHDFNNILASVIGYSELLKLSLPQENKLKNYANQIYTASLRARDLVQQILTFSRKTEQDYKNVQISLVVKEVLKLLRASLPSSIEFETSLTDTDGLILADAIQIHQLVMNLCTNASYAMQENGGVLSINLEKIIFDQSKQINGFKLDAGEYIKLHIQDTGHGIDPDILKKVFDPFFTTKPVGEGTGLGLSVVHGIVKSHNGEITLNSVRGEGTTIDVYFPRIEKKSTVQKRKPQELKTGNEWILYVDDDEAIVKMNKEMLEGLGYNVAGVTNSLAALELFKTDTDLFDLVITDLTMPHMKGDRFAQELLKIKKDLPIILLTGSNNVMTKEKSKKLGIKSFLKKPLLAKELTDVIRKIIKKENEFNHDKNISSR